MNREISKAVTRLCVSPDWPARQTVWESWQHLQMQRLRHLIDRLRQTPETPAMPVILQASAVIALGRTIMALRSEPFAEESMTFTKDALSVLRRVRCNPEAAIRSLEGIGKMAARELQQEGSGARQQRLRCLVGHLGEAALLLERAGEVLRA